MVKTDSQYSTVDCYLRWRGACKSGSALHDAGRTVTCLQRALSGRGGCASSSCKMGAEYTRVRMDSSLYHLMPSFTCRM
jgi:hypothetical protein